MSTKRRWTEAEDSRLFSQVKAFPQNLSKCFYIVSTELNRSPHAVCQRWYSVTSKKPQYAGFCTNSTNTSSIKKLWASLKSLIRK